jgi:hypothetical protein
MKVRVIAAVALALVIAVGLGVRPADSQSRILSFSEIKPGMEGVGKTVIKGTEIQTFSVKVIDVIDNPGVLDDHIVVRVSGPTIRQAGGVAAGMSGSPIYINNKLAGALWGSWGFQVGAEPIALIRPIETMLALVKSLKEKEQMRLGRLPDLLLVPNLTLTSVPSPFTERVRERLGERRGEGLEALPSPHRGGAGEGSSQRRPPCSYQACLAARYSI